MSGVLNDVGDGILEEGGRMLAELMARRASTVTLRAGTIMFLDGDPLDTLYEVRRGVVRCFTVAEDGQKHIFSFSCQGALIGLGAAEQWHYTAEAVGQVSLRVLPRSVLSAAMRANPLLGEWRARMVDVTVQAREQQLLTMASRTAEERLMVFLRDFAEAAGPDLQRAGGATALPMSRRDIAEHLGISFETVSRGFTSLKRRGALELIGPGVYRIRDASAAEGVRPRRAALRMTGARGERALDEVDALEDEMYRPQAV